MSLSKSEANGSKDAHGNMVKGAVSSVLEGWDTTFKATPAAGKLNLELILTKNVGDFAAKITGQGYVANFQFRSSIGVQRSTMQKLEAEVKNLNGVMNFQWEVAKKSPGPHSEDDRIKLPAAFTIPLAQYLGGMGRFLVVRLIRFIGHHILSVGTPVGRKARPKFLHRTPPLIRVKPNDLRDAGIRRVPRVIGVRNGLPLLEDNRTLNVRNIIWCTGYDPGFSWIHLPVFDNAGDPWHERGVVAAAPGLYFIGLQFLYSMTSATLTGVGRDAKHIVKAILTRAQSDEGNENWSERSSEAA